MVSSRIMATMDFTTKPLMPLSLIDEDIEPYRILYIQPQGGGHVEIRVVVYVRVGGWGAGRLVYAAWNLPYPD